MQYLLLGVAVTLFVGQSLSLKYLSWNYIRSFGDSLLMNTVMYGLIILIFLPAVSGLAAVSPITIGLGLAFGITFVITIVAYAKAMSLGPLGYTALFFSGGLLIPVLTGSLIWQEPVKAVQVLGFLLLLASFVLANLANGRDKSGSLTWFLWALLTFFANGSLGALVKSHQILLPGEQISQFMLIAFMGAFAISLTLLLRDYKIQGRSLAMPKLPWWGLCLAMAATTAFGNQLMLVLSGSVPSIILFPVVNGGVLIGTGLASRLVFQERFSRQGMLGFAFGAAALVILSL